MTQLPDAPPGMDNRRYYGLDALRGSMMMLGIVLHGATFYLSSPPPTMPMLMDRNHSYLFDLVFHFIHSFRMPTFFVLAGLFASLLIEKRGMWGTYKNRAARILGPLVAGAVTVLPIAGLFMIDFMLSVRFGTHSVVPDLDSFRTLGREMIARGVPVNQASLGHLWFLYYLLYFYLLLPLCRWLADQSRPHEVSLAKLLVSPRTIVFFSLCTALTLWPFRGGQVHEGFLFIRPHWPSLLYYGLFFVLGYLFHTHRTMLKAFVLHLRWCALLALVLFPLSLYLTHLEHAAASFSPALHLAAVLVHAFCTWSLIYVFIGGALRFFDTPSPWILYVSQSSYWVFLIHLPVIAVLAWWLVQYDLPAILKFLLVTGVTTPVCLITYHYWVQDTWMGSFLNGRRFSADWPWRAGKVSQSEAA